MDEQLIMGIDPGLNSTGWGVIQSYKNKEIYLMPENSKYSPIKIGEGNELSIWGVVTYVVKKMI